MDRKGYNKNGDIDLKIKDGNGKGKEFNNNGYLIFEGKFLNGKRLDGEEKNIMMMAIWYLKEYI